MKNRGFIAVFLSLIAVSAAARSATGDIRTFGPDSGPILAVLAPDTQWDALEADMREHPPANRIVLVPQSREKAFLASADATVTSVLVLAEATDDATKVCAGCRGKTTPAWLLSTVRSALDSARVVWKLDESRMPLYRLGWTRENPRLAAALEAGIPAIQMSARSYQQGLIAEIAARAANDFRAESDTHFLVMPGNAIMSETTMVAIMIVSSAVILFFLFVFSFLLGKKSDQRLRDFFGVWWLPFFYFAVNIASLALAQRAVSSLVVVRFGNREAWSLIPVIAFAAKVAAAWFIGTLVLSLNQLLKFPEDSFIYGYIASIACLVNVFAFASFDFSLSIMFLSAYLLSIIVHRFNHPAAQVIGMMAIALPFVPYCAALVTGTPEDVSSFLGPLYRDEGFWNARLALFIMPAQLFAARLAHTLGVFGKRTKWYLPVNAFVALAAALAATGALILVPAYSAGRPLVVPVTQTVTGTESRVSVAPPIDFPDLVVEERSGSASQAKLERDSALIVPVHASTRRFLDRQLVTISVRPVVPYDRLEIEISGDGFISVLDSSERFELRNAGSSSLFFHENPEGDAKADEWTVSFSSPADEVLTATVRMSSPDNPWGVTAVNENVRAEYRLDTVSVVPLSGEAP